MRFGCLTAIVIAISAAGHAQPVPTRAELIALMKHSGPSGWNDETAAHLRSLINETQLRNGFADASQLTILWAIDAPQAATAPRVITEDGRLSQPMTRVGKTTLYAAIADLAPNTVMRWSVDLAGRRLGGGGLDVYAAHADERERPAVPKGTLRQMPAWQSKVCDGTTRDRWLYIPAQLRPGMRAAVTVFQDGATYKDYVPIVFDNLIEQGEIPVMVGVFISPGVRADGSANRSFEYDTLSPQYASFLIDEILPEVEKLA